MRVQEFIDGYDWKARVIPTAITLLPTICTAYSFYPGVLGDPVQLAGSSLLAFALVYLASMFFRDLGVRYARTFWDERGGLPSTRFARMRDSQLSHVQKSRIQLAVWQRFQIKLMSLEEECEYPALADRKIMDAFREVKELLRRSGDCHLVEKHGAEYGFVRNLCGARMIFVAQAVSGIAICAVTDGLSQSRFTSGCWVNAVLLTLWIPFAWMVLPRMMELSAEAYAGRAWITFLALAETTSKKPGASVNPGTMIRQWASSE